MGLGRGDGVARYLRRLCAVLGLDMPFPSRCCEGREKKKRQKSEGKG